MTYEVPNITIECAGPAWHGLGGIYDDVEPTLHDIARGTTGCGDDDDIDTRTDQERAADEFYANEYQILAAQADAILADYIDRNGGSIGSDEPFTIEHVHDAGCNGTLEHGEEILCGYPGSTGHIYCQG